MNKKESKIMSLQNEESDFKILKKKGKIEKKKKRPKTN